MITNKWFKSIHITVMSDDKLFSSEFLLTGISALFEIPLTIICHHIYFFMTKSLSSVVVAYSIDLNFNCISLTIFWWHWTWKRGQYTSPMTSVWCICLVCCISVPRKFSPWRNKMIIWLRVFNLMWQVKRWRPFPPQIQVLEVKSIYYLYMILLCEVYY